MRLSFGTNELTPPAATRQPAAFRNSRRERGVWSVIGVASALRGVFGGDRDQVDQVEDLPAPRVERAVRGRVAERAGEPALEQVVERAFHPRMPVARRGI